MISDKDPIGIYSIKSGDYNRWMKVESKGGKLVYWTIPGIIKDLSEMEEDIDINFKITDTYLIRRPKFVLKWADGDTLQYRVAATSRQHFLNLITGLYKPIYDRMDDVPKRR